MSLERMVSGADLGQRMAMAAAILPNGSTVVEQTPGERFTPADAEDLGNVPEPHRSEIYGKILTSQYVAKVYNDFMGSEEGKAYVQRLKREGNGNPRPGELETIVAISEKPGLVAATYPDHPVANMLVNAEYIDTYCRAMAVKMGLSYDDILKAVIVHELNHYFGQTHDDRNQSVKLVELDNDTDCVEFYTGLAEVTEDPEKRAKYITMARVFADRYDGAYRKQLDTIIDSINEPSHELAGSGLNIVGSATYTQLAEIARHAWDAYTRSRKPSIASIMAPLAEDGKYSAGGYMN